VLGWELTWSLALFDSESSDFSKSLLSVKSSIPSSFKKAASVSSHLGFIIIQSYNSKYQCLRPCGDCLYVKLNLILLQGNR